MTPAHLKEQYNILMQELSTQIDAYNFTEPLAYANWLAQTYYFVRHSTRLLGLACGHANFTQGSMHLRMAKHVSEEFAHDRLAEKDLKELGISIQQFTELNETKIFYRNQYFGIEKLNSAYLLGYILFLEGFAVTKGPAILARVKKAIPNCSHTFVRVHAEEDVDHIEKAFAQINSLSESEIKFAAESLMMSALLYKQILHAADINRQTRKISYTEADI